MKGKTSLIPYNEGAVWDAIIERQAEGYAANFGLIEFPKMNEISTTLQFLSSEAKLDTKIVIAKYNTDMQINLIRSSKVRTESTAINEVIDWAEKGYGLVASFFMPIETKRSGLTTKSEGNLGLIFQSNGETGKLETKYFSVGLKSNRLGKFTTIEPADLLPYLNEMGSQGHR